MNRDRVFLNHVRDEIYFLLNATAKTSFDDLMEDEIVQRAILRSLEVIGEAVKNLSSEFKESHPEIEWKKIAGLRDRLIHQYFGVDWLIIWDIIETKLPPLKKDIERIIDAME